MPNASNGESCPTKLPPTPPSSMKRPGPLLKNPEDRAASSHDPDRGQQAGQPEQEPADVRDPQARAHPWPVLEDTEPASVPAGHTSAVSPKSATPAAAVSARAAM